MMGLARNRVGFFGSGWRCLALMLSDAGRFMWRLNAGEGLCNPRVGRRFRWLLPCVVEMDGDGSLWTVDGASASSMARVTCREEPPERSGKAP